MTYTFEKDNCWYKEVCLLYNTEECFSGCIRYIEMFHLMENSYIPKKKQYNIELIPEKIDIESFKELNKIKKDVLNFVNSGKSLYLYSSNSGNGKTTFSIKIMLSFFDKIWSGNGFETRGLFLHVPTIMRKIKQDIGGNKDFTIELSEKLENTDLVIWDDIVVRKDIKDFDYELLTSFIDIRLLNEKANIYTANYGGEDLRNIIGNRLFSRIYSAADYKIELKGSDRR
jgi:DNA replication protein DnaC